MARHLRPPIIALFSFALHLHLQAEKEWAWCEREMAAAAKALGYEGPNAWTDALAAVSADHAPPGEQPDVIKRLAEEAIEFLEERDLVTIPPLAKVMLPHLLPPFAPVLLLFRVCHCCHRGTRAGMLADGDDDCRATGRQPVFHRRRSDFCFLPVRTNVTRG